MTTDELIPPKLAKPKKGSRGSRKKPPANAFPKGKSGNAATQFKPGQSGNPGGRPKSVKLNIAYAHILGDEVPGDPQQRTYADLIALAVAREAIKGKIQAAIELADRTEGKVRTSMEITGAGGLPLLPGAESIKGESDEALALRKQKLLDIVNGKKPEEESE